MLTKFSSLLMSLLFILLQFLQGAAVTQAQGEDTRLALQKLEQNVSEFTLSNGLRVIMYRRGTAPIFSGVASVHVGGSDEELGYTGISHMFEHMAFKGTKSVGTKDYGREKVLLEELEEIAKRSDSATKFSPQDQSRWQQIHAELKQIWIDGALWQAYETRGAQDMNATTDRDLTNYMVSLPRSSLEFWAWIESERLLNPVIRQFYQERDVVLEEKRMRYENAPENRLYELMFSTIYTVHPYRMPVIGYDYDIRHLTAQATEVFRRRYYVPGNIAIALVGDVNPAEDIKVIEKYFGRIPVGPIPERPPYVEPQQEGERRVILEEFASPIVAVAYRKPNYPHPDDPPLSIMYEMLAGGRTSMLYKELVEKKQLATGIDVEDAPGYQYPNAFFFSAAVRAPHSSQEFLQSFDNALEEFVKGPVDSQLLEMTKTRMATSYLQGLRSNLNLAKDLATSELTQKAGWRAIVNWYSEAMAVDADMIKRVSKQYLNKRSRTVGMLQKVSRK